MKWHANEGIATEAWTKREFAKDLKAQLDRGYEPKRIGSWAHKRSSSPTP